VRSRLKATTERKTSPERAFLCVSTLSLKNVYGKLVFTLFVNIPFLESCGKTIKVRSQNLGFPKQETQAWRSTRMI
jgi:hypothetical protein